jgi:hypothetical protein
LGRPVAMGKHRNNTSAVDLDLRRFFDELRFKL